jgi:hypothetical protein
MYASIISAASSIALVVFCDYLATNVEICLQDEEHSVEAKLTLVVSADFCDGRGFGCQGTEP